VIAFFSVVRSRSRLLLLVSAALLCAACGSSSSASSTDSTATARSSTHATMPPAAPATKPGPEGVPLEPGRALASAFTTAPGTTVDGIQCAPVEQLAYHIHAHLQVYLDGQPRALPGGIGLIGAVEQQTAYGPFYSAEQCYYWLHTHTSDGVIHIESPTRRIYTLGDFFDEWRQPLSADRVAGANGEVTAFINGRRWPKSPRSLPLSRHAVIQLDVGSPLVPFRTISWAGTSL
jgi:hypothetical protein